MSHVSMQTHDMTKVGDEEYEDRLKEGIEDEQVPICLYHMRSHYRKRLK